MLARPELDPARMQLIVGFFEQYVQLTEEEEEELKKELEQLEGNEEEEVFQIQTSWEKKGEARGEARGEQRGEQKGERKGRAAVASRLLEKGMSVEEVMSLTDLTKSEVEQLISNG